MFGEVPGFHTVHVSLFAALCSGIGDGDLRLHQEMLISDKDWDFDGDSIRPMRGIWSCRCVHRDVYSK